MNPNERTPRRLRTKGYARNAADERALQAAEEKRKRRRRRNLLAAGLIVPLVLAASACVPQTQQGGGYDAGPYGECGQPASDAIHRAFDPVGQTATAFKVVHHESHCEPAALNRSSGAAGLFQLLGHDDLIFAACPNPWGVIAWDNPFCNADAARSLWDGSGWRPWAGAY